MCWMACVPRTSTVQTKIQVSPCPCRDVHWPCSIDVIWTGLLLCVGSPVAANTQRLYQRQRWCARNAAGVRIEPLCHRRWCCGVGHDGVNIEPGRRRWRRGSARTHKCRRLRSGSRHCLLLRHRGVIAACRACRAMGTTGGLRPRSSGATRIPPPWCHCSGSGRCRRRPCRPAAAWARPKLLRCAAPPCKRRRCARAAGMHR